MSSDAKRLAAVFAVLVGLIAAPFLIDAVREKRRPVPVDVRVVTATAADPVFSSGDRRLAPGEAVEIALALQVRQLGRGERWLAPVERLRIDGGEVEHETSDGWPDADRALNRVLTEYPNSKIAATAEWMLKNLDKPLPEFEDLDDLNEQIEQKSDG